MPAPEQGGPAISVSGLSKRFQIPTEQVNTLKERALHPFRRTSYNELRALKDVSFDVSPGEFFGVVGRNGSGKSTLMKCIAGIYRADAGEIWARGRIATFIELGVGFNPELAARDNVVLNAIMLGLDPAEARRRYPGIIEFAELEEFANLKLKNYSSGMQVRLAFSVMAHVDADVLLIDEVLAVGDAAFQQKCHDALTELRDRGCTIVLVTHDMNAVERFCDRALLLERGEIDSIDEPVRVARRYTELNFQTRRTGGPSGAHMGDGGATIEDAWFEDASGKRVETLEPGALCAFVIEAEFVDDVEHPEFGAVFTDERNQMVWAVSSASTRSGVQRTGSYRRGDRLTVAFRFSNVLTAGRYHASPEVARPKPGRRLMDHHENAATVLVTGGREGTGSVDLPFELELRRAGAGLGTPAGEAARL
jgi:ABC-type polysaccharide/polyol phosphate transport system ATPase subunit